MKTQDNILHIKHEMKYYITNTIQNTNIIKRTCTIFIEKNQKSLAEPQKFFRYIVFKHIYVLIFYPI